MSDHGYHFGIDLGTTNSCIAVVRASGKKIVPQVIPLKYGRKTLPSCVWYRNGEITVGDEAYKHRHLVDQVVYSAKRDMGTNKRYKIDDGSAVFRVTPVQVATEVLKELVRQASELYPDITSATISVPAYFNSKQRADTRKAAIEAGLNVVGIISEPTAAALAFGLAAGKDDNVLVYDLGGGTFDVSLLEIAADAKGKRGVRCLATGGNAHLGGDDLDRDLYDSVVLKATQELSPDEKEQEQITKSVTEEDRESILLALESAKKSGLAGKLTIPVEMLVAGEQKKVLLVVTPQDIQKSAAKIYANTKLLIQQSILSNPQMKFNKIILVGGSTKLEYIRKFVEMDFPKTEVYYGINPDECVALGAAVNTAILQGGSDMLLNDIIPLPIGVSNKIEYGENVYIEDRFSPILRKNAILPATGKRVYSIVEDIEELFVHVYQGIAPSVLQNEYLGSIHMKQHLTAGDVVEVGMVVNTSGILKVAVKCQGVIKHVELVNVINSEGKSRLSAVDRQMAKLEDLLPRLDISEEKRTSYQNQLQECRRTQKSNPALTREIMKEKRLVSSAQMTEVFVGAVAAGHEVVREEDDKK